MSKLHIIWRIMLALLLALPVLRPAPTMAAQGRKFALVVGVGKGYQSPAFRTLVHPEEDAAKMAEQLRLMGFTITGELFGEKATKAGIAQAIDELGKAADNPFDLAIFYFSGHGAVIRGGGRSMPGLVPADAAPGLKSSFITDTELGTWLNNSLGTRQVALILDSCYSAGVGGAEDKRVTSADQIAPQQVSARLQAVAQAEFVGSFFSPYVILASSQAQETSKETEKGGLFTYYLLQGLGNETSASCPACDAGRNDVSFAELMNYAAAGVRSQVDQAPQLKGSASQAEQLALLVPWVKAQPGLAPRPRPTAVAPSPAPSVAQPEPSTAVVAPSPELPIKPQTQPKGRLTVTGSPAGSKIKIGNKAYKSPINRLSMPPGIYTVTVEHKGYETSSEEIDVVEDKDNKYAFHLAQLEPEAAPSSYTPQRKYQAPQGNANPDIAQKWQNLEEERQKLKPEWQQADTELRRLFGQWSELNQRRGMARSIQERQNIEAQMQQIHQRKEALFQRKKQMEQRMQQIEQEIQQLRR